MTHDASQRDGDTAGVEVKICGLTREADVRAAAAAGARYGGFVFAESPRRVTAREAARLGTGSSLIAVGVFVDSPAGEIMAAAREAGLRILQLHGGEPPELCGRLRASGWAVWKALRPRGSRELGRDAARYRGVVDGLLVEGRSADGAGGVGAPFPLTWLGEAGLRAREGTDAPRLIVAGGLDPRNVTDAVRRGGPDVVDVSSGVEEAPGRKDPELVRRFVAAATGGAGTAGAGDGPRRRSGGGS